MSKSYRIVLPILALWLACWTFLAWAAIQDDALIHLRYATNLYFHHFVTYDGVHPDYGASSLLYITVLAVLRSFTSSPNLPHAVSSAAHLLLFALLATAFSRLIPVSARTARLAALTLLILLVMPAAMRWLDDGMETGIVVAVACITAWLIQTQRYRLTTTPTQYIGLVMLAYFAVMLRTELLLLFGVCFLILIVTKSAEPEQNTRSWHLSPARLLAAARSSSHIMLGAALAVGTIIATMHVLLPDTALAKAHGLSHWRDPFGQTVITLAGALSFGLGMLIFWLLTLVLILLRDRRLSLGTLLANALFPTVLLLSSLRGQDIQGVRYFSWTFFFSIIWNILELAQSEREEPGFRANLLPLYGFLAILLLALPFETIIMRRVLSSRDHTQLTFQSQHLDVLKNAQGVAFDIGYVGYYTQAKICDLAGLVNGRISAAKTSRARFVACAATNPDFMFLNAGQLDSMGRLVDLSQWQSCGQYDLVNVRSTDRHYLIVRPALISEACAATGQTSIPVAQLGNPQTATR